MPRDDYNEHRQARIDRLEERAERKSQEAGTLWERSRQMSNAIPLGQPILVGHYSENQDRRYRDRIRATSDRAYQTTKEAETLAQRAHSAANNTAISSDDPDALDKLRAKLETLERRQDHMSRVNKAHKAYLKNPATLDSADFSEETKTRIRTYQPRYSWEPHPFAPFELQNNNANIRRIKQRIEDLSREFQRAEQPDPPARRFEPLGVELVENRAANRVQLVFPGKPAEEVRAALKQHGFRWARTEGAWQRQLSAGALALTEHVLIHVLNQRETQS